MCMSTLETSPDVRALLHRIMVATGREAEMCPVPLASWLQEKCVQFLMSVPGKPPKDLKIVVDLGARYGGTVQMVDGLIREKRQRDSLK